VAAVTIKQFRAQVKSLLELGCHSLRLSQWAGCMAAGEGVAAGAVIITFDGLDWRFQEHFWPILKRAGFSATIFLATDLINAGDRAHRSSEPNLSLGVLQHMYDEGIEIGSLGASGRRLTGMSPHEIACEAADSLTVLHERVASSLPALAYPSGETDPVVQHLAGGAGYCLGLTMDGRKCALNDAPMALPRCQISRDTSGDVFTRLVRH
jgi:peptidoglycan/xylan/chitin deacetylase (PgdA/CDA1 family)